MPELCITIYVVRERIFKCPEVINFAYLVSSVFIRF